MQIELIADFACNTGENPLWHPVEKKVYWVDIPTGRLFRHDPRTRQNEAFEIGSAVGGFTIQADGTLLLFMARGAVSRWREGKLETVIESLPDEQDNRFNDVIADPEGRVFCGTMSPAHRLGRLYRLDPDRTVRTLMEGVGTSNGIGFTPDLSGMYHTDTRKNEIRLFEYDRRTGGITRQRVFVKVPASPGEGRPDGLTVDAEGCVWSARWDGGCVVRYSPAGQEIGRIPFPARKVSCITFGGDDYSDLYVTTAGGSSKAENGPGAGALFRVRPGVPGVPEFRSRIGL